VRDCEILLKASELHFRLLLYWPDLWSFAATSGNPYPPLRVAEASSTSPPSPHGLSSVSLLSFPHLSLGLLLIPIIPIVCCL
jgi:hypothetical protein